MSVIWRQWLTLWCYLVLVLGIIFAGSAFAQTDAAVRLFYDLIYWPLDGQSGWHESLRLTAAILKQRLLDLHQISQVSCCSNLE